MPSEHLIELAEGDWLVAVPEDDRLLLTYRKRIRKGPRAGELRPFAAAGRNLELTLHEVCKSAGVKGRARELAEYIRSTGWGAGLP